MLTSHAPSAETQCILVWLKLKCIEKNYFCSFKIQDMDFPGAQFCWHGVGPPSQSILWTYLTNRWETDKSHSGISRLHDIEALSLGPRSLGGLQKLSSVFRKLGLQQAKMVLSGWVHEWNKVNSSWMVLIRGIYNRICPKKDITKKIKMMTNGIHTLTVSWFGRPQKVATFRLRKQLLIDCMTGRREPYLCFSEFERFLSRSPRFCPKCPLWQGRSITPVMKIPFDEEETL